MKSVKVDSGAYRPKGALPVALALVGVLIWAATVVAIMGGEFSGATVLAVMGASLALGLLWLTLGALVSAARDTRYLTAVLAEHLLARASQEADPSKQNA